MNDFFPSDNIDVYGHLDLDIDKTVVGIVCPLSHNDGYLDSISNTVDLADRVIFAP